MMFVSSRVAGHLEDQDHLEQILHTANQDQVTAVLTTKTMLLTVFIRTARPKTQQCTPTLTGMLAQGVLLSHYMFTTGQ